MADEDSLFLRASSGDPAAAEQMLEHVLPRLRAFVRARLGNRLLAKESASDLVQSVCREALTGLADKPFADAAAFRHWLFKLAVHKIVDKARFHAAGNRDAAREQSIEDVAATAALASLLTPSRDAAGRERLRRFEQAFAQLPEDYRQAIVLHRIVGLSYADIATELRRSEGAARNLVYRGLARLTSLMGDAHR